MKKTQIRLRQFTELILEQNPKLNLISRKNPEALAESLLQQALITGRALSPVFKDLPGSVLDIGSGNGFPGLPLAILQPKVLFFLCERNRKKAEFLKFASHQLELSNIKILCVSAEEIKKKFRLIVSQAGLPTEKMLKLLKRLLLREGEAFLWKSASWQKRWPEACDFSVELFKSYRLGQKKRVLLRVKKSQI